MKIANFGELRNNRYVERPMNPDAIERSAHILLCEDSPPERMALAHLLRDAGYDVDEADNGEVAISHLQERPVDLVLLDLQMPRLDGFAVLGYMQQHRRALPVVLLSGLPPDKIQHKMHVLPTRELPPLLIKPVDPQQLLSIIELQLNGQLP